MTRLLVAGVYLVGFWIFYPIAETIVWVWNLWDRVTARRHDGIHATSTWYAG